MNDAFSLKTQAKVVLKVIESDELPILRIFNAPSVRSLPNNRTVPILETIHLEHDPEKRVIIVMPFLRWFFDPPFETLHQILDACQQLLSVPYIRIVTPLNSNNVISGPRFHSRASRRTQARISHPAGPKVH